jgi:hypothetical protein
MDAPQGTPNFDAPRRTPEQQCKRNPSSICIDLPENKHAEWLSLQKRLRLLQFHFDNLIVFFDFNFLAKTLVAFGGHE